MKEVSVGSSPLAHGICINKTSRVFAEHIYFRNQKRDSYSIASGKGRRTYYTKDINACGTMR